MSFRPGQLQETNSANEGDGAVIFDHACKLGAIRAERLIEDAPVKGQCARHYWYGEDGVLEDLLSKFEGMFGSNRRVAEAGSNDDGPRAEIKQFLYFQHWRTAKAADRLKHSWEQLNAASWGPKEPPPEPKPLLMSSMRFGLLARDKIEDLKIRFVENRANIEFVVGDDPAVMLRRQAS